MLTQTAATTHEPQTLNNNPHQLLKSRSYLTYKHDHKGFSHLRLFEGATRRTLTGGKRTVNVSVRAKSLIRCSAAAR